MFLFATGNPFISSYLQSDWMGKGIFIALFALSIFTWTILLYKVWLYYKVRKLSTEFIPFFSEKDPLNTRFTRAKGRFLEIPHPFFEIYRTAKQKVLQLSTKNHHYIPGSQMILSDSDMGMVESQVYSILAEQHKILEKNLFILSTIVSLGPFLGLLGTVWGILLTFSELHSRGFSSNNSEMLSGLSMALTTTVIGLLVAIPALIGYNYLKNRSREYRRDMENFSQLVIASLELHYRRPDHAQKISSSS